MSIFWLWHATFCRMPGWRVPEIAKFPSMRERLFKIRCLGCWYSTHAHGYEIAAMAARSEDRQMTRLRARARLLRSAIRQRNWRAARMVWGSSLQGLMRWRCFTCGARKGPSLSRNCEDCAAVNVMRGLFGREAR